MKIKNIDINKVIPYHNNPRKNQAVDKVASSINEYGFQQPIVVDKNMVLIVGHTRLLGAKKLGLKQVPIHIADLSEAKAKAYRIADNRLNEDSNWDFDLLDLEVKSLLEENYDIDLLGFDSAELDKFLKNDEEYLTDEDEVPEPPEKPKSEKGNIYQLGEHRLMCGDATNIEVVKKLLNGYVSDLIITDPPYNVNYGGGRAKGSTKKGAVVKAHGSILNDKMNSEEFDTFISTIFKNYSEVTKELASIYVFHPDSKTEAKITFETFFGQYLQKSATLIWNKGHAGVGYADYRPSHEPILYGWKYGKGKHFWCGDKTKKTILDYSKGNTQAYVHPTQKPVNLLEELIINSSKGQDVILDFFGGSGSTLIACEKTKRKCFMMELDLKYADVIIQRWENFTGKKAKKIN